jgi:hypothetical protein
MAKIMFSAVVGDARKKAGGVVFTKGRTGAVIRRKVSPVQPRTPAQRAARAQFTALSKNWSTAVTPDDIAGWNALALQYPRKDQFGQTKKLTGLQLFQSCNRNLQSIGITTELDTPPPDLNTEYPGDIALVQQAAATITFTAMASASGVTTYTYSGFTGGTPQVGALLTTTGFSTPGDNVVDQPIIAVDLIGKTIKVATTTQGASDTTGAGAIPVTLAVAPTTYNDAQAGWVVYATPQLSAGKRSVGKKYTLIKGGNSILTAPVDVSTEYALKFGAPISGRQIGFLMCYIGNYNGAKGTPSSTLALIA